MNALKSPRPPRRIDALVLSFFLLLLTAGTTCAATLRWTGGHATSSDWSRGANWDTGTAPANGDTIVFPAGSARLANNNDLTGLSVATIRFIGAGGGYTLSGNAITVTGGISAINTAGGNTIALARITLANPMSFTVAQAGLALTIDSEVRLNGNNLTGDATGFLILRGVVSGAGNVTKIGDGLLTLSGAAGNTFTGDLRVNAGTLFMGKTAGMSVTNRLIIGDGVGGPGADTVGYLANEQVNVVLINTSGLLSVGNFTEELSALVLNQGGDVTTGPTGKLRLGAGADVTVSAVSDATPEFSSISGNLELGAGTHVFDVGENAAAALDPSELVIDAVITGTGLAAGLTKEGAGDLELRGNNTFGGQVIVNAGELRVGHAAALGATGTIAPTTVNNTATILVLDGVDVGNEVLRLNSAGGANPALRSTDTCSWAGDIVLQRDTRIGVAPDGDFTLRGTISGTGDIAKQNTGLLRIGGNAAPNTFNGDLLVNAGTVELDKGTIGGLVAVPGRLIIGDGAGGEDADVVRYRKDNQVSAVTINGSGLWDLGVFDEEVSDLVFNAAGRVTTATNGLLRLGIGANVAVNSQTLDFTIRPEISGQLELMLGSHTFNVSEGPQTTADSIDLFIDASIRGVGALLKTGAGDLALYGSNSFAGTVTVDAGSLHVADSHALGSTLSGTRVNNDASLHLSLDVAITNESLTLDSTGQDRFAAHPLRSATGSNFWSGPITLLRDTIISVQTNQTLNLGGAIRGTITGAGSVIKEDHGTLIFSGDSANTYPGVTTVNEGRLVLNKTGVNVAVPGRLIIGDDTGGANADVVECLSVNEIGSLSTVTVNSSGQFITMQESIGALAGSGNVSVSSSLNAGDANTTTVFHGVISGAGAVNKIGTGTLTFNGNNTYTGGTGIADGTLLINGQQPSSFVLIQPTGWLGGSGRVGNLSMFAGGATVAPGSSPGRLTAGNVQFTPGSVFRVDLEGPVPGTQHDQLRAFGTVDLGQAELNVSLAFTPTLGQPFVILDNDGADAIIDRFAGLQEGDTLRLNLIPFIVSYKGGDGNDVTLTATNKSVSVVSTRVEAGNGNGVIEPGECNHFFVALMNETGNPLAVSDVVLDSATPGVVVTQQRSDYANFPALGIRTNAPAFQFLTSPDFVCGRLIEFRLTLTVSGSGTFTVPVFVSSGSAGEPVIFNSPVNLALADNALTTSTLAVSSAEPHVGKVAVSLYITHPTAGDLVLRLRSPSGTTVRLARNLGGTTDNYGASCGNQADRTTFDDGASVRIAAGTAPFVGSFTPEQPLAAFLGEDPNGDWQLLINDTVAGDAGELRCWSLLISPPECGDGGGACESCVPVLGGSFIDGGSTGTQRLVQDRNPSSCGIVKTCPGVTTALPFNFRTHTITNNGPATCVAVALTERCPGLTNRFHVAAYLGAYNPADPCANYLGDSGGGLLGGANHFSFAAPADATIVLVVNQLTRQPGCESYTLRLYGLPCPPPTLHIEKTANPDEVRLYWSTAYPGFDLQRTPSLNGAGPYPFVNVPFTPIVVNGDYSVTNSTQGRDGYHRLRKP